MPFSMGSVIFNYLSISYTIQWRFSWTMDTAMQDSHKFLDAVIEISKVAGKKILEVYETDFDVEHKEDNSPLTKADMAANNVIVESQTTLTPDIPMLSDEEAKIPIAERASWGSYWQGDHHDEQRALRKGHRAGTCQDGLMPRT